MILFDRPTNSCCDICKGCIYHNQKVPNGGELINRDKPCDVLVCNAGVLTKSLSKCYTPCKNPIKVPGKCCPVCPMQCKIGRKVYEEGTVFQSNKDKCVTCECKNGGVSCEKKVCPVLNCPTRSIYTPKGECCPQCKGKRTVFDLGKGRCLFRGKVYPNSTSHIVTPDKCSRCICIRGTMQCLRDTCPVLNCPRRHQELESGQCCPVCKNYKKCKYQRKRYRHGATWKPDSCTNCSCNNGTVHCQIDPCDSILECPVNSQLQVVPGKCCPQCVDTPAICTVFGDPHYRTFDGRIFNFQGRCSYILARDCQTQSFDIRVRNYARVTNSFSWTKSISIRVGDYKIQLRQKLRVKVNGEYVMLPFAKDSLIVSQGRHTVAVSLGNGVKVVWDGDSYLEVTIPPSFKNKMCGLCGNFNNNPSDDLQGRDKVKYFDPNDFAETWKLKSRHSCKSKSGTREIHRTSSCDKSPTRMIRAQYQCAVLQSAAFAPCHAKVDVNPFYKSCVMDICDCPNKKECSCESITAYIRACNQLGYSLEGALPKKCLDPVCPEGATWNACASACPLTCSNISQPQRPCNRPCKPSCQCPPGTVQHKKQCIQPSSCPEERLPTSTGVS